jgi:hypothetical protein
MNKSCQRKTYLSSGGAAMEQFNRATDSVTGFRKRSRHTGEEAALSRGLYFRPPTPDIITGDLRGKLQNFTFPPYIECISY